jgi:hypothetical protein
MKKERESDNERITKDTTAPKEESLNQYYTRKQQTKENEVCGDGDSEVAGADRDAEAANYPNQDAGPRLTGNWGRFGR